MQRTVPDEVLGRVLGVLEGILIGSIGVGGLLAPAVIEIAGIRGALIATGLLLPILALAAATRLRSIDRRATPPLHLELLHGIDLLARLPAATLEALAGSLVEVPFPAGTEVVREGAVGDRYYVIAEGEVEVAGPEARPGRGFRRDRAAA